MTALPVGLKSCFLRSVSELHHTFIRPQSSPLLPPLLLQPATAMAAAADTLAAGHRLSTIANGFVGQANPLAAEYHFSDYDWLEHAEETAPLVEAQWQGAPTAVRQAAVVDTAGRPLSAVAELLQRLQCSGQLNGSHSNGTPSAVQPAEAAAAAVAVGRSGSTATVPAPQLPPTSLPPPAAATQSPAGSHSHPSSLDENEWEVFYRAHPAAKFFKERRYLLLEFPCLAPPEQLQHVVEIGAGCGSSVLPVLRANPQARATLTDVSSTCLQQLLQAMQHLGLDTSRVDTFTADGTSQELGQRLSGCGADAALIMFTLSAVVPEGMLGMMRNAAAALRPGGVLCIRDHALYDMVSPAEWRAASGSLW
jgi:hypothetical protein